MIRELLGIAEGAVWIQRHCVLLELKELYALAAVQHKSARRNESKQRSGDLSPDACILEVESLQTHLQLLKLALQKWSTGKCTAQMNWSSAVEAYIETNKGLRITSARDSACDHGKRSTCRVHDTPEMRHTCRETPWVQGWGTTVT